MFMRIILTNILLLLCFVIQAQVKNSYGTVSGAMTVSGTTLTDNKGSSNGTLAGSTLPSYVNNWYLDFTQTGAGTTSGNYNRVTFALTDYSWDWSTSFSQVIILRCAKSDALTHRAFSAGSNLAAPTSLQSINISTTENATAALIAASGVTKNTTATTAAPILDGKFHVVSYSYKQDTMEVYFDGKPIALTTNNAFTTGNFYVATSVPALGAQKIYENWIANFDGEISYFMNYTGYMNISKSIDLANEFLIGGW
jgi:hypothetical protein